MKGGRIAFALAVLLTAVAGAGVKEPVDAGGSDAFRIPSVAIIDVTEDEFGPIKGGKEHRAGETRWTDALEQASSNLCDDEIKDCVRTQVRVRNDSPRPIQCRLVAPKWPDEEAGEGKHQELVVNQVIFAGNTSTLASSYGARREAGRKFKMDCRIYDETYVPLLMPPECGFKLISVPNPDDFYPRGAKRREESGEVVVEVGMKRGTEEFENIRVALSAGYEDLDNAALKVAAGARGTSKCSKQRYRFKIRFVIRFD